MSNSSVWAAETTPDDVLGACRLSLTCARVSRRPDLHDQRETPGRQRGDIFGQARSGQTPPLEPVAWAAFPNHRYRLCPAVCRGWNLRPASMLPGLTPALLLALSRRTCAPGWLHRRWASEAEACRIAPHPPQPVAGTARSAPKTSGGWHAPGQSRCRRVFRGRRGVGTARPKLTTRSSFWRLLPAPTCSAGCAPPTCRPVGARRLTPDRVLAGISWSNTSDVQPAVDDAISKLRRGAPPPFQFAASRCRVKVTTKQVPDERHHPYCCGAPAIEQAGARTATLTRKAVAQAITRPSVTRLELLTWGLATRWMTGQPKTLAKPAVFQADHGYFEDISNVLPLHWR